MGAAVLDYQHLVADAPPRVIHTEEENRRFLAKLEEMNARWDVLSPDEHDYYDTIRLIVSDFEKRTYNIPAASPLDVIEYLLDANGMKRKELVDIFKTQSLVSDVLNGKRPLTLDHIRKLSVRFRVSPSLFIVA